MEEQVFALIKGKYGEVETKPEDKISAKDLEKKIEKLQLKKMSDFEKYKLGKMTKDKFIQSKEQTDKEIEIIKDKIKLLSQKKKPYKAIN